MTTHNQEIGTWGENKAVEFLLQNGYYIRDRNFKIRACELDIVAEKEIRGEMTLCFIEVKTRESDANGSAERATGREKLNHLFHAATEYCLQKNIPLQGVPMQFEQVSIYREDLKNFTCHHYIIPLN